MDSVIKVLSQDVANQIAAGEVVQRPASVVKELMENSIDSGATHIQLYLTDAGRTSIKVIDNGCGMSFDDAPNAFLPHATSKIKTSEDLFAITSFGFRGEALASIAEVSNVVLRTRRPQDQTGTVIEISAGQIQKHSVDTMPVGTGIDVKNLFFNIPARRKFLKNDSVEYGHILHEFQRVALSRPQIEFDLYNNQNAVYQLKPSGLKQRIMAMFGDKMESSLLPVELETELVSISGFVSRTDQTRQRGFNQYFFVNDRFMKHPYFHKAVMDAYTGLIPDSNQPSYFLNFKISPQQIDVNIHPSKTEIKFADERDIWQCLSAAVHQTIGKFERVTEIDFNTEDAPQIPVFRRTSDTSRANISKPVIPVDKTYNPFKNCPGDWMKLYPQTDLENSNPTDSVQETESLFQTSELESQASFPCFQYGGRYIISQADGGLLVVDQHRAGVFMKYNQFLEQMQDNAVCSQRLLFPELFSLSTEQAQMLPVAMPLLTACGFVISDMGHGAISLSAVPTLLLDGDTDYSKQVVDLIELSVQEDDNTLEQRKSQIASYLAQRAAIPYGKQLTQSDMCHILAYILSHKDSDRGADGKRIYSIIAADSITRLF